MSNEGKPENHSFVPFISHAQHEARLDNPELPDEHAERLIGEVTEVIEEGIQSHEEAVSLLAKLAIAIEASKDPQVIVQAEQLEKDIKERYPGPFK